MVTEGFSERIFSTDTDAGIKIHFQPNTERDAGKIVNINIGGKNEPSGQSGCKIGRITPSPQVGRKRKEIIFNLKGKIKQ